MAYTAKLLGKNIDTAQNRVTYIVEFTDGQQIFNTPFNLALYTPVDQIKKLIKERIAEYETADIVQPAIAVGPVDLTGVDITVPVEAQEYRAFIAKKNKLESLNTIKNLGFLTGAKATALDTAITDLKATMHTDFKQSFVNFF